MFDVSRYNAEYLRAKVPEVFDIARKSKSLDEMREQISLYILKKEYLTFDDYGSFAEGSILRVRDAAGVLHRLLMRRSDEKANFSVAQAIRDIAFDKPRPDFKPAFYAELIYLFLGMEGRGPGSKLADLHLMPRNCNGRQTAEERSKQLDELSIEVKMRLKKFSSGLDEEVVARRKKRKERILKSLDASEEDWNNWQWHIEHIMRNPKQISEITTLSADELNSIETARKHQIPFGITPYYLSLMDDDTSAGRDRSIRAQVFAPPKYIHQMVNQSQDRACHDFMLERETSPINLITRRYPAICILKPFDTCPQICVYCQRNWEIKDAMQIDAKAAEEDIVAALDWIRQHKSIHEVLVTGGDPLAMSDDELDAILQGLADIPTIERIRIGSRTLVTLPMRITDKLVDILAKYRVLGKRQIAVVTHIQHSYEVTPETAAAVEKLRMKGIPVYNQMVYTFFVSRRFEAYHLRRLLALIGVEPYYTFNTKGKEETVDYRVPIARLLQEQNEEARLLPGLTRTDEAVFNVPGLGKHYLRGRQHRDLISILPDGTRIYEFHPWEKHTSNIFKTYIGKDVPILDYLQRLDEIGEDVHDYETVWYYY